jgi:hypothetical protein
VDEVSQGGKGGNSDVREVNKHLRSAVHVVRWISITNEHKAKECSSRFGSHDGPQPRGLATMLAPLRQNVSCPPPHHIQGPALQDVLKPELLVPLLKQEGMLERLAPHLPEEHRWVGTSKLVGPQSYGRTQRKWFPG